MTKDIIKVTEAFVKSELGEDSTGHDWYHIERVRNNAMNINKAEKTGDPFIIDMAALLHDIPDEKLNDSVECGKNKLEKFLESIELEVSAKLHIMEIINTISYKGGHGKTVSTMEAKIVQDADRLDAIGAIGIARTFAFGGKKGQLIYDPSIQTRVQMTETEYRMGKSSSIHHFYEKLLKLKDLMNTETAKKMAESRQEMMETFLVQFYNEWDGIS
ncbi:MULTISPECIES: HD domain-containing protein [unclassified Bacillus (in: firmicutes)]|uniref:HD domain-containing protein n=1 Tax=unclassified Bacillus (in: firmicutes) TaxID=185979 RepID=UPI0008EC186D|nr:MULTISPECIES: HD domain-containing protein [unclassified Bacillus (in: firmicutes)]SFB25761.1 uncharacterized protein SAMN02799634_11519 [Bacillus sp. UNCCL13]SFQ91826.1 uncharacterized protein SAMN04488577_0183 [Bacillus sp. cl95]